MVGGGVVGGVKSEPEPRCLGLFLILRGWGRWERGGGGCESAAKRSMGWN